MAEANAFKVFKEQLEKQAESDPQLSNLLSDLSQSLINRQARQDNLLYSISGDGYGYLAMVVALFLYHLAKDYLYYRRAMWSLKIAEMQAKLIKSLADDGMDQATATIVVSECMKSLFQRGSDDEALIKAVSLLDKGKKDG